VNALAAAGFSPLRYRETLYTVGRSEKRKTAVPGKHVDHYWSQSTSFGRLDHLRSAGTAQGSFTAFV